MNVKTTAAFTAISLAWLLPIHAQQSHSASTPESAVGASQGAGKSSGAGSGGEEKSGGSSKKSSGGKKSSSSSSGGGGKSASSSSTGFSLPKVNPFSPPKPPGLLKAESAQERSGHGDESSASDESKKEAAAPDAQSVAEAMLAMLKDDQKTPEKPPDYVTRLSNAATAGKPGPQCWYAAWLLGESQEKGAYDQAVTLLQDSAKAGYAPAEAGWEILTGYMNKDGYSQPDSEVLDNIKRNGDAGVLYFIGEAFLTGRNIVNQVYVPGPDGPPLPMSHRGVDDNCAAAFKIMSLASSLGSQAAELELSTMYQNGLGTERNPRMAFSCASAAVAMNSEQPNPSDDPTVQEFKKTNQQETTRLAEQQLGMCYATGVGTPADPHTAATYLSKSQPAKPSGAD